MFDAKHYVPILKWKRAEQGALQSLDVKAKKFITPLIQFVMPAQKEQEQLEDVVIRFKSSIPDIVKQIFSVWGKDPIFIDSSLLFTTELKAKNLELIVNSGRSAGGQFIPVVHLNDEEEIKKAAFLVAKKTKCGLCLRLICENFIDFDKLNKLIKLFLSDSHLGEEQIDLLIDIKESGDGNAKCLHYLNMSQQIYNLPKWRTYSFASGSYPENLSECKLDEENLVPRFDWLSWKDFVATKKKHRSPSYADYTIQYPLYKASTQFFHPTASIKYTLETEWLIIKGKRKMFENYLAGANLLAADKRFYGGNFSAGDKLIIEKADYFDKYMEAKNKGKDIKGTGGTETWLRVGINHHLTLVAHQIAKL